MRLRLSVRIVNFRSALKSLLRRLIVALDAVQKKHVLKRGEIVMPILEKGMGILVEKSCPTCRGRLRESETECPVCKARAYEAQVLKQRLELIQSLQGR